MPQPWFNPLRRRLATGICFLNLAAIAAPVAPWSVCTWKSNDGLPNNHVTGLAQTPDGFLWVATFSHPARFDGVRFEEYFSRDLDIASNQKITALQLSRHGLWLGTSHGRVIFLNSGSIRVFTNGLPDKVVQTLTEDGEGAVWITFQGGMVNRIQAGAVTAFGPRDGLPSGTSSDRCSLACDAKGQLWFAKNGQAGIIRQGHFETLQELPATASCLAAAKDGGIWICSGNQLLKYHEGGKLESHGTFKTRQPGTEPTALLEDQHQGIWIGTADSGLFHYDGGDFENIPVSDEQITSLTEDREGNIWAGTESGGLNRLRPRVVDLETAETGLPGGTLQSLCQAADGTVWATTPNGLLLRQDRSRWKILSTNTDWPGGRATCVAADPSGAVWIGTRDHQLHCWHDGQFITLQRDDGLLGREIHALLVDKNGDVWIGEESPDVVQRLRTGKLESFAMPPGTRIIRAMTEDAGGNIWVGTSGGILAEISNGVVSNQTTRTTGQPLSIRCLHATTDGGLWIGYADEGVGWFKDGHFVHLTSAQNFPEENVSQIISDADGRLWFGGDHGIFKVRQQELEQLASGSTANLNYVRYGPSEGLFSLEANCGDSPGTLRDSHGWLWIPMRTALAVVNPSRRSAEDSEPPPVLLRRVTVDDQTVASYGDVVPVRNGLGLGSARSELRLPPGHHRLEFEFTAFSFGAPENVRFRYRLEGFDEGWIDGGTQRSAGYSRLAAGHYRFRVKACNSRGIWNENGAALSLVVAPFVWQTWWFRSIALAVFTSLVVAMVRYISFRRLREKLRVLEQQAVLDRERARIARDIHDDLGGRLTEVELLIESVNRVPPEKRNGQIGQISATIRQVGESLDEIVWAVNPRHDSLPHLMDYLGQYAIQFLQTAGLRCRVDFPDEFPQRTVPPEVRHSMFLAVKEALNNVVRHAQATEIWLRASSAPTALTIIIEDNGKGFAGATDDFCADGLRNMRHRMEEIGGQFRIDTGTGPGTRIILTLPLLPETISPATPAG